MNFKINKKQTFDISYIINYFLPSYIFILSYILNEKLLSLNIAILVSLNQLILFSFSAHKRNLFLLSTYKNNFLGTIYNRLVIAIIVLIIDFLFIKFYLDFSISNSVIYFCIIILMITVWIKEIFLAFVQLINFEKYYYILITEVFLLLIFTLLSFYKAEYIFYLINILILFNFVILIFLIKKIKNNYDNNLLDKNNLDIDENWFYLSSLSIALSAFLIRLIIENNFSYNEAADYVFIFSICSLLSSIYVNSFGINIEVNRLFIPNYFKTLIFLYILCFLILLFFFIKNIFLSDISYVLMVSLLGSLIFFYSQKIRLKFFSQTKFIKKILFKDIILSLFQLLLIIMIVMLKKNLISYFYLIFSLFSYFIYAFFNFKRIK